MEVSLDSFQIDWDQGRFYLLTRNDSLICLSICNLPIIHALRLIGRVCPWLSSGLRLSRTQFWKCPINGRLALIKIEGCHRFFIKWQAWLRIHYHFWLWRKNHDFLFVPWLLRWLEDLRVHILAACKFMRVVQPIPMIAQCLRHPLHRYFVLSEANSNALARFKFVPDLFQRL